MAGDPRVDHVLVSRFLYQDPTRGRNRAAPTLSEWLPTIRGLRARRYDLAIDFRGDFRTIFWLAYGCGARRRLSWFSASAGRPLLTDGLDGPGHIHEVEANLRLVATLGLAPMTRYPRLQVTPAMAAAAEERLCAMGLAPGRPRVGFHCFAISALRTWPAERFAHVMGALEQNPGARPLLLGSPAESAAATALLAQTSGTAVSLVGQTSLQELVAILSRLDLVICLDSGLLHLAAAVGTPTVSLFGPGEPARWRPLAEGHVVLWRGLPCSPCRDVRCIHATNRCMQEIEVQDVVTAARRQLGAVKNQLPVFRPGGSR
jgi:lipopolysaccharide heptosyltransferase II